MAYSRQNKGDNTFLAGSMNRFDEKIAFVNKSFLCFRKKCYFLIRFWIFFLYFWSFLNLRCTLFRSIFANIFCFGFFVMHDVIHFDCETEKLGSFYTRAFNIRMSTTHNQMYMFYEFSDSVNSFFWKETWTILSALPNKRWFDLSMTDGALQNFMILLKSSGGLAYGLDSEIIFPHHLLLTYYVIFICSKI